MPPIFTPKILRLVLEFLHCGVFDTSVYLEIDRQVLRNCEFYKLVLCFEYMKLLNPAKPAATRNNEYSKPYNKENMNQVYKMLVLRTF